MAEKDQEHLRIRLGPRLLKRIDAAREKSGRTRSDEIEARLNESFTRMDIERAVELAVRNTLESTAVFGTVKEPNPAPMMTPAEFYAALVEQAKKENEK
jgi:hypothetical protein